MNHQPDNYEDDRQSGGAVVWLGVFVIVMAIISVVAFPSILILITTAP